MARRGGATLVMLALTASLVPAAAFANGGLARADRVGDAPALEEGAGKAPVELSSREGRRKAPLKASRAAGVTRANFDADAPFAPRGEVYPVATIAEFDAALEQIAASDATEATIRLSADIGKAQRAAGKPFAGIPGKTVMLSSVDAARHTVHVADELVGGIVFDNVAADFASSTVFACGNRFETTDRFAGSLGALYGGGKAGSNVAGDCDIILRGGYVTGLFGGGLDGNVAGNVSITIDAPTAPGILPTQTVGTLHGGGHAKTTDQGRVGGNVTIDFRSGSNGAFFGGGLNEFDKDQARVGNPAAMVEGTVTVNLGYKGAPARSVWPGVAMYSYAGSEFSTVGAVCLNLLDGCTDAGDRDFFACGINDTVLRTVQIVVEGDVDLDSGHIRFGGDVDAGDYYVDGNINILNQGKAQNAVYVRWNTPMKNTQDSIWVGVQGSQEDVPLTVEGDVLVEVESGYLAFVKLDSETSSAVINGNSTVRLGGNAKIAQLEGNKAEYESEETEHKTVVLYDGAEVDSGYHYEFDEVRATNGSRVTVDGSSNVFPMFGSTQKPFYSVDDLVVDGESSVTTRNSQTKLMGDVLMDRGTWHAKGYTYVYGAMDTRDSSVYFDTYYQVGYGHRKDDHPSLVTSWTSENDTFVAGCNTYLGKVHGGVQVKGGTWSPLSRMAVTGDFAADGLTLQLPVIAEGSNYPAASIPLAIGGTSSGRADVVTVSREGLAEGMDASAWTGRAVVPTLGENYITSWAPEGVGDTEAQDNPVQAVFKLAAGVKGPDAYFLKRLPDADADNADSTYMWQVADGFAVTFDKNNSDEGSTEASPASVLVDACPGDAVALGKLPGEPTRPGYVFDGWYANAEGTGEAVTAETLVDGDVTFYARWATKPAPEPTPDDHVVTIIDRVPGHEDVVIVVEHGGNAARPQDPVRPGFTFGGWFADPECTIPFDFSEPVVEDVVVYGKWTPVTTGGGEDGGTPQPQPNPQPQPEEQLPSSPQPAPQPQPEAQPAPQLPATGDIAAPLAAAGALTGAASLAAGAVARRRRDRAE